MPAIQRSEFSLALNQIAQERGVDPEIIMDSIKTAILAAYKKDHVVPVLEALEEEEAEKEAAKYSAEINSNTGETKITYEGKDVTPPGFGRIATQTAKQVLLQKIREREKDAIMAEYTKRIGTVVNGMILRFAGSAIVVDIGKAEAIIPQAHRIQNENYYLNKKLAVYIVEIAEDEKRGREIIVSRTHNGLLEGLLKREVPEVAQGSVEIKAIEREPGNRSKIAVYSSQPGIDPVGSCVGQKGVRVQAIIAEFNGLEKIDIIQWQENARDYLVQALSPAKNITVDIDEKEKTARVKVPQDELSLAIGKDGQNVRLASKLTGYRIEIEGEEGAVESKEKPAEVAEEVSEIKPMTAENPDTGEVKTLENVEPENDNPATETSETVESPETEKPEDKIESQDEENPKES
jgi:N utilization substance protein A